MSRHVWDPHEIEVVQLFYADSRTEDIARALAIPVNTVYRLAARLGLRKTEAYLASPAAARLDGTRGSACRFLPGQEAWNKGLKGSTGKHPNCRRAQFKKGRTPEESHNYVPIGSEKITKDGYLERKVTDDQNIVPARRWVVVHRLVWEAAHGPVPAGHAIAFLPGRHTTDAALITLDALELVSRAELARRNHPRNKSPELAKLVQLKGAITRQVNRIVREAKEKQS
ncbi:HNH endonuclease [Cupriavidus basilensis]|uniref:HNH endonuclease n=1 Tax=Cupriavidus basilensis TaxID=68895 RepID=UPI0009E4FEFB|nr:HNH endonuclease [Cupriavidus basilensis]